MEKIITVDNVQYSFHNFDNMWRVSDSEKIIDGHKIDFQFYLENFKDNSPDWDDVQNFISFLRNNQAKIVESVSLSKSVLLSLFKAYYKDTYSHEIYDNLDFVLAGIDYKGHSTNVNIKEYFIYELFFNPVYTKDEYRDMGTFTWITSFQQHKIQGASVE